MNKNFTMEESIKHTVYFQSYMKAVVQKMMLYTNYVVIHVGIGGAGNFSEPICKYHPEGYSFEKNMEDVIVTASRRMIMQIEMNGNVYVSLTDPLGHYGVVEWRVTKEDLV